MTNSPIDKSAAPAPENYATWNDRIHDYCNQNNLTDADGEFFSELLMEALCAASPTQDGLTANSGGGEPARCSECGHACCDSTCCDCGAPMLVASSTPSLERTAREPEWQGRRPMIRVEQRTERDCLRCCVAMVTGIEYEDVPDFVEGHGESWPNACEEWLREIGCGLLMMNAAPMYTPPWLSIIARGPTEHSNAHHFVVVTPNEVIDPHPSQAGLKEVAATYAIVNSGALANDFINHLASKYSAAHAELSELKARASSPVDPEKHEFPG